MRVRDAGRTRPVARYHGCGMSTRVEAGRSEAATAPGERTGRLRGWFGGAVRAARASSLAQRFLLANLAILLVAGLAVGIWVGNQLERSIVERTASVTALYVESLIEPSVASMADGGELTAGEVATLDAHLASSPLAERVRSLRLWSRTAGSCTAPTPSSSVSTFPVDEHQARAWEGEVVTGDGRSLRGGERLGAGALGSPPGDVHPGA